MDRLTSPRLGRWFLAAALTLAAARCPAQTPAEWATQRALMVEKEVATAGIKNPAILAAMREVPRHEFVPAPWRSYAYLDIALPIGGQVTISPPFIVAWMTQKLALAPTDHVLEIGTGSGYHAAVLSRLAREVYSIEINPTLAERARATLGTLGYQNVAVKLGDGYRGWAEHAPFDKILVTCSPEKVPQPLIDELREGGRIVIPLGERYQQTLFTLVKQQGKLVVQSREPTFFVPMLGQAESLRSAPNAERLTELANGDFEQLLDPAQPAVWYYLRQARLAAGGPRAGSQHYLECANRVGGQNSQALQAIGVDGRRVGQLAVELWVKAEGVEPADKSNPATAARLLVSFFDEGRAPVGHEMVGPWQGSFDWRSEHGLVRVPRDARVAIVAVGLLGATGKLSCDDIQVRVVDGKSAARPSR